MVAKYAYADQKENIRVASVKSVARILTKIDKLEEQPLDDLYMAVILILHDEHPEVRGYLVQSQGISKFLDKERYSIESSSLSANKNQMVVDLNEQVVSEEVLRWVITSTLEQKGTINRFLVPKFIASNLYREQTEKNFDDKIFFFEPPNKFCDQLQIKKTVFSLLYELRASIDRTELEACLKSIEVKLKPSIEEELLENTLVFEQRAQKHIINLLLGQAESVNPNGFLESLTAMNQ